MSWGINSVFKSILIDLGHIGGLRTKISNNVHDVQKLVQKGTSVPKPIWVAFKSQKLWKIVKGYVISVSVVSWSKHTGTTPEGPTKGPRGGPLKCDATLPEQCESMPQTTLHVGALIPMSNHTYHVLGIPSPKQSLNIHTYCWTEGGKSVHSPTTR